MKSYYHIIGAQQIFKAFSFPFFWYPLKLTYPELLCHQFSSVAQSCPTLCDPMNRSTPGLPVHHQLPEFTQTHVPAKLFIPYLPFLPPSLHLSQGDMCSKKSFIGSINKNYTPNKKYTPILFTGNIITPNNYQELVSVYSKVIQLYLSIYSFFFRYFPIQVIEQSSLCYTVGPCWLSISYLIVCVCSFQAPNLFLLPTFLLW